MHADERSGLDAAAAAWVAREDRGPLSADEQAALAAWLARSPRHYGAYARARAVMAWSGRAAALGGELRRAGRKPRWRRWWMAGMASAAMAALVAWLPWRSPPRAPLPEGTLYATERGQILRVALDDGSAVTLDAGSRVRVRFGERRRDLELLAGTALFDVARDPSRPFAVAAGDRVVTAVGTRFAVARDGQASPVVEVLVSEGIVDVGRAHARDRGERLRAGMRAVAVPAGPLRVERLDDEELQRRLLWREGLLAFDGDTLAAASERFRRYGGPAILVDPRVAGQRIVGLYPAHDPAGFARHAALSLGLRVELRPEGVRLSPSPADTGPGRDAVSSEHLP